MRGHGLHLSSPIGSLMSTTTTTTGGFRLGSITHQSSPYALNQHNKYFVQQQQQQQQPHNSNSWTNNSRISLHQLSYNEPHNSNTSNNDDDSERPQVFQVEADLLTSTTTMTMTNGIHHHKQHSNSLNISANGSANDSSLLSNQTKSSLKTSLSTQSQMTSGTSSSREVKHVKFKSDHHQHTTTTANLDSPIMFSRSSSLTSLNSFDAKSVHSSVASEYSRRQSGAASPSDLPDSPDDLACTYIMHKHYLLMQQQQQQQQQRHHQDDMLPISRRVLTYKTNGDLSRQATESSTRSNEITIVERTILGAGTMSTTSTNPNSNSNSEKNSFYCKTSNTSILTNDVTKYNVENSPWRTEQHSADVSNLSAPTFDDDNDDDERHRNEDGQNRLDRTSNELNAIFSLLKTRKQVVANKDVADNSSSANRTVGVSTGTSNLKMPFTPPVKLASIKETVPFVVQQQQYKAPQTSSQALLPDDMPKLYCDENTPGNISPYSSMSELSVPSLIKQDVNKADSNGATTFNLNLLLTKLNLSTSYIGQMLNDCDEIPKVYGDTEGDHNETTKMQDKTSESIIDTDSPKIFITEDTPICCSHYSSVNSLNHHHHQHQHDNEANASDDNRAQGFKTTTTTTTAAVIMDTMSDHLDCTSSCINDKLNKSNSVLLSDSCHKPMNTPAGLGNMSRASFDSASSSETSDDDDDDDVGATSIVNNGLHDVAEEGEEHGDDDDGDDDEESKKSDANTISTFLNEAMMPSSSNRDIAEVKTIQVGGQLTFGCVGHGVLVENCFSSLFIIVFPTEIEYLKMFFSNF